MEWQLDPSIRHLNHGAFGAVPREVGHRQAEIRAEIAANPTGFMARELEGRMDAARVALAAFVGSDPEPIAWIDNTTTGVNTVLAMFERRLSPGEEVLVTDHEYNACRNALDAMAGRSGAVIREVILPFPTRSGVALVDAVLAGVTSKTRLVVLDHVTSQTAMILPVERLVAELARSGIPTLVDGAHAPGMVPLDLDELDAAFYVGNCHKWMCAPHGSAFLRVASPYRGEIEPLVVSHGWNDRRTDRSRFRKLFDWTGTDDPSAFLSVPAAIECMGAALPGGWHEVMESNRAMALAGRRILLERLAGEAPVPDELIGSMATVRLPNASEPSPGFIDPLTGAVLESHGIEVPVFAFPESPHRVVRISAQLYNTIEDYEVLVDALEHHLR